jgi:hypothetical protein
VNNTVYKWRRQKLAMDSKHCTVRKIPVLIDFSKESDDSLSVSLAQKTQAELIVLHVTQRGEADGFLDLLAMMEGERLC